MKTNKEKAFEKMLEYAGRLAYEFGLDHSEEKKNNFWADFGSRIVKWTSECDKDITVEFRSRFGHPRIDFHYHDDFASVELSQGHRPTGEKDKYGCNVYEYDGIYRPEEIQAWGEGGLAMATNMWRELSELIHQPTNDFIEDVENETQCNQSRRGLHR